MILCEQCALRSVECCKLLFLFKLSSLINQFENSIESWTFSKLFILIFITNIIYRLSTRLRTAFLVFSLTFTSSISSSPANIKQCEKKGESREWSENVRNECSKIARGSTSTILQTVSFYAAAEVDSVNGKVNNFLQTSKPTLVQTFFHFIIAFLKNVNSFLEFNPF